MGAERQFCVSRVAPSVGAPTSLESTLAALKTLGFDCLGPHTQLKPEGFGKVSTVQFFPGNEGKIPDPWSPAFKADVEAKAASLKGDQNHWYLIEEPVKWNPEYITQRAFSWPARAPGKMFLQNVLKESVQGKIALFNLRWKVRVKSFDEIRTLKEMPFNDFRYIQSPMENWYALYWTQYAKVVGTAIQNAANSPMVFAPAFQPRDYHPGATAAFIKHFKGLTIRDPRHKATPGFIGALSDLAKKSGQNARIFISDVTLRARRDEENRFLKVANTAPMGRIYRNQKARTRAARRYLKRILRDPAVVGYAWYSLWDSAPGKPKSEFVQVPGNVGLYSSDGKEWTTLTAAIKEVHNSEEVRK
jgi:hypothetical protein